MPPRIVEHPAEIRECESVTRALPTTEPRRVLMTADTVGGVWTYSLELARALGNHGVEVTLATMGLPLSQEQRREASGLPSLEIFESQFKLEWMEEPWRDVALAGDWLLELEQQVRPDVIHLNGYAHGVLPWSAPVLMVGHSCVLSWWRAVKGEPLPATWKRYFEAVRDGLHAAHRVVAPSRAMLAALEFHYGPLRSAEVIPNGREGSRSPAWPKEELILSAGRLWDEAKNVAALTKVAREVLWPVYVAGEERHPEGQTVRPEHVHLLGRLTPPELAQWFARASIYVLPARYEPFGLSVLEAALAGCALVLGDIPSLREIWQDAAVFVPPNYPEALKTTLRQLIANPSRTQALAERTRDRAREFTPRRMAAGYLSAYARLLQKETQTKDEQKDLMTCES